MTRRLRPDRNQLRTARGRPTRSRAPEGVAGLVHARHLHVCRVRASPWRACATSAKAKYLQLDLV